MSLSETPKNESVEPLSLKETVRQLLWVARQFLWNFGIPAIGGSLAKGLENKLKPVEYIGRSKLLSSRLLTKKTIDGAIIGGLTPPQAWAKYALPKGLPLGEERVLAIENEPHLVDDFSGKIGVGYGEGEKTLLLSDLVIVKVKGNTSVQKINYHVHEAKRAGKHWDVVVTGIKPGTEQWEMNIPRGPYKGRYAFVKTNKASIVVRMKEQGVLIPKPAYTLRKEEVLTAVDPAKSIIERKTDGSLGNAYVKDTRVYFRSHREGGEVYYDKLPAIEFLANKSKFALSRYVYPHPDISGTIFQGELAHQDGAARVSGILNSLPANARAIQALRGPVRFYVWDILQFKGRDVSNWPYERRRALFEKVVQDIRGVNKNWFAIEKLERETPEEFYRRVTSDPLPWGEGIVVKSRDATIQKWDKIKMTGFGYFKLVGILPGEAGKYGKTVGKLVVENMDNGARGEVGSLAVPDEFRNWMWEHRDDLVGEIVKIRSQETTARGVPRAGTFYGFHNGEVDLLMQAESYAGGDPARTKEMLYRVKSAAGWRKSA